MAVKMRRDLRQIFGPARDQGNRPTCLAFAVTDAHSALRIPWELLSCEHLYYLAIQRMGTYPQFGVSLAETLDAVRKDGQTTEVEWPYMPALPSYLGLWKPPTSLTTIYRRDTRQLRTKFDTVVKAIDRDTPIILGITISDAFYTPDSEGIISSPEAIDPTRRHAVIAVGHGENNGEAVLLFRNSWGHQWGLGGVAWVTQSYITPRILSVSELTGNVT